MLNHVKIDAKNTYNSNWWLNMKLSTTTWLINVYFIYSIKINVVENGAEQNNTDKTVKHQNNAIKNSKTKQQFWCGAERVFIINYVFI